MIYNRDMETGVIYIELIDKRSYKIIYLNSTQKKKVLRSIYNLGNKVQFTDISVNGLHTAKQWYEIANELNKE